MSDYPIKDLDGLLIPDPFPAVDFPELTPGQSEMLTELLVRPVVKEFNERVREAFRSQFVTRPSTELLDMVKRGADADAFTGIAPDCPITKGRPW